MITQENIKNIIERIEKLKDYLNIDQKLIEISNEEEQASNPDFWNNSKEAEILMRLLRYKKNWVEGFNNVRTSGEELQIIYDFYKEEEATEEEIKNLYNKTIKLLESLEFKNMLSDEGDNLSAVLQITAGAGGTESCDWAAMLMRMYLMWSEKQG